MPALAIPTEEAAHPDPSKDDKTGESATKVLEQAMNARKEVDIADPNVPIPKLEAKDLPQCPQCGGLLRPGVVWFGEALPKNTISAVKAWVAESPQIDLILVIGTSSQVYPAAGYVDVAREKGARVAVINMDRSDIPGRGGGLKPGDWFFEGDAGEIVPELLKSVIGEI